MEEKTNWLKFKYMCQHWATNFTMLSVARQSGFKSIVKWAAQNSKHDFEVSFSSEKRYNVCEKIANSVDDFWPRTLARSNKSSPFSLRKRTHIPALKLTDAWKPTLTVKYVQLRVRTLAVYFLSTLFPMECSLRAAGSTGWSKLKLQSSKQILKEYS